MKFYELAEPLNKAEQKRFSVDHWGCKGKFRVLAVLTNKFRKPLKGEWYLSGAICQAYRAPNNLTSRFWICRLAKTVSKIVEV